MSRKTLARSTRLFAAISLSLVALTAVAATASALVTSVDTFKTSIDVNFDLTESSTWQGISPGCYAPQEEFDQTYKVHVDSRPKKSSKIKTGVASLTGASFGVTPNYGAKGSFTQVSKGAPWTLQTQYPAGCAGTAPAVPAWATSPTCKKISERVEATLLMNSIDDPDQDFGSRTDGVLIILRTPRAKPTINGASIGASCYRTLQDVDPKGLDSLAEISLKSTLISVPVPRLAVKLKQISEGSDRSKPSFNIPIRISGSCDAMSMTPYIGQRPDWTKNPFSLPHQALGSTNGDPAKSPCFVSGKGKAVVRRVGPVVSTGKIVL